MGIFDKFRGNKKEEGQGVKSLERGDISEYVGEEIDKILESNRASLEKNLELKVNGYERRKEPDGTEVYKVRAHVESKPGNPDDRYSNLDFEVRVKDGGIVRNEEPLRSHELDERMQDSKDLGG